MTTAVFVLARALHMGSAMLLVALSYFLLAVLRPVRADEKKGYSPLQRLVTQLMWSALVLEVFSGGVWFWIVAAQMAGASPWTLLDSSDLNTVLWQTQFGQLWFGRLGIGAVLGVMLGLASAKKALVAPQTSLLSGSVLLLGSLLLGTLAWAGHAAAGIHDRAFHLGIDLLHLLIGSVWPMGLVPLGLFLRHIRSRAEVPPANSAVEVLRRFSRASFTAVLLLAVTGIGNAWLMIPTWTALVTTTYGQLLLAKVVAVAVMVGLGACNRFYFLPRMHGDAHAFQNLRRTIFVEFCLACLVLLIVGIMGITAPPS